MPPFRLMVTPRPDDIDELDHVSNLVYVRWVLEVALAHSDALGYDHAAYRRLGAIFVVRRHEIDYLAPVLRGEEVALDTWVDLWHGASCVRRTALTRHRDGAPVAQAATTWAFVDLVTGRPRRILGELRAPFALAGAPRP